MRLSVLLICALVHAAVIAMVVLATGAKAPDKQAPQALQVSVMTSPSPTGIPQAAAAPAKPLASPSKPTGSPETAIKPAPATGPNSLVPTSASPTAASPPAQSATTQAAASQPPPASAFVQAAASNNASSGQPNNDATAANQNAAPVHQAVSISASYAATNPVPPYPAIARRLGEQGTVVLRILVAADGSAREIQIKKSSGSPTLDRSAETTIKQWRFNPAKIDGKPVEEWYETRWTFRLEG